MSDLPVCRGGEAELLSCFEIENFSSPQVQAQLRAGLGMCPAHARRLFDHVGEGHIMTIVMREALTGARAYVKDDAQPGSCPTCEAAASGSRRASQLVTDGLRDPAMVRLDSQHQGMCLVHVLQALPRAEAVTVKLVAERLLHSLQDGVGRTVLEVLAGADRDAQRRALWRERLPELPTDGSTVDRVCDLFEIEACHVCLSTAQGWRIGGPVRHCARASALAIRPLISGANTSRASTWQT